MKNKKHTSGLCTLDMEHHYMFFLLPMLAHQAQQGDGFRKKMRKIIGRSVFIMATPVEKQALNWHKAIWFVFTVKQSLSFLSHRSCCCCAGRGTESIRLFFKSVKS